MPLFFWLASFLGSVFSSLVSFFMSYMSKRIAIVLAVVSAIAVLTTAFFIAIYTLVSTLVSVAPTFVVQAWSLLVPDNLPALVSACLTARVLRWVYDWNVRVIQFRLS